MAGRLVPRQRRTILGVAVLAAALVPLLVGQAGAVQFCNTNPIVYTPPGQPTPAVQRFLPYPSTINVTGLTGTISDVNVTFNDITHPFPEDIDVLLVAPDGTTRLVVMSDIGGNNDGAADPVTDVDLTFDDQAASTAPTDGQLVSGTYRPTNDNDDAGDFVPGNAEEFPAPAPASPYTATALAVFNGLAPTGNWSLYVVDDEPGPNIVADFGGGWCIDVTTGSSPTSTSTSSTSTSTTRPSTTTSTVPTTSTSTSTTRPSTTTSSSLPPSTTSTTTPAGTCDGRTPTIVGTAGADNIFGTPGPDVILAGGGSDRVDGLGGDDVICGGAGDDLLLGGDGNDRVFGEAGNDLVRGGNGNDVLSGGAGTDNVQGEEGNDALNGGPDPDQCIGGNGTDTATACENVSQVP